MYGSIKVYLYSIFIIICIKLVSLDGVLVVVLVFRFCFYSSLLGFLGFGLFFGV